MSHHFAYRTTWAEQRGNSFFLFLDSNSVWTCLVEVQTLCHVVIVVCKRHVQMSPVWHRHWQSSSRATAAPHTHKSTLLTEHWSVLLLSHTPMQRRVGELLGLGLYKAGRAASWSKHFHTRSRRKQEERRTPGAFFFPATQLSNRHLSESEMATFVSVSFSISSAFRTVDSSPQTRWPLQWWSVLTSF